jgi:hypothetical protein
MKENHNIVENVEFWKNLSGLSDDFPKFEPLESNSDDMTLVYIDPKQRDVIIDTVQSNALTVIRVPKGWGATTLFRYMLYEYTKHSSNRKIIPIQFDFENDVFLDAEELDFTIKWQILKGFLQLIHNSALEKRYCCEVIAYKETPDVSGHLKTTYDRYKILSLRGIDEFKHDRNGFLEKYTFFNKPLNHILNYLLKNLQLQTVFFFLFGSVVAEDNMLRFSHALKQVFDSKDFMGAAKKEVFFCTPSVYIDLNREYQRPYAIYDYPRYSPAEIYRMLGKRHRPISLRTEGGREEKDGLESVFAQKFVDLAYKSRKKITIAEVITQIEKLIEERLDCPRGEIPIRLTPKE